MSNGKIVSLLIREEAIINYEGKDYVLKTESYEAILNGLVLSKAELGQLKKLPSNIKEILIAKFFLKGKIEDVFAEKQIGLNL